MHRLVIYEFVGAHTYTELMIKCVGIYESRTRPAALSRISPLSAITFSTPLCTYSVMYVPIILFFLQPPDRGYIFRRHVSSIYIYINRVLIRENKTWSELPTFADFRDSIHIEKCSIWIYCFKGFAFIFSNIHSFLALRRLSWFFRILYNRNIIHGNWFLNLIISIRN